MMWTADEGSKYDSRCGLPCRSTAGGSCVLKDGGMVLQKGGAYHKGPLYEYSERDTYRSRAGGTEGLLSS